MEIQRVSTQYSSQKQSALQKTQGETAAQINTSDTLQKSEPSGFLNRIKCFVKTNITGASSSEGASENKNNSSDYGSFVKPAAVSGAVIGGIGGAVIGYVTTETDITKLPEQTLELKWSEPVLTKQHVGYIPRDFYEPIQNDTKPIGKEITTAFKVMSQGVRSELDPVKPVFTQAPIMTESGGVMTVDRQEVFTGRGDVKVNWESKPIGSPYMEGYIDDPKFDTRQVVIGHTPDGTPVTKEVVDGIQHRFAPEIKYDQVGTYKTPSVEFKAPDPWERAGMGLAIGALAGLGIGTAIGVIHKVLAKI